jgi:AraC-like DNA-binding protein
VEPKTNHLEPGEQNMTSPFSMAYMDIRGGRDVTFSFLGRPTEREKFPPDVKAGLHRHSHYEVVFVLEGEYIQRMENGNFRYRAGDAIFLNRSVRHGEDYDSDCVLVFLNLSPAFLESLFLSPANQLLPDTPQYQQGPIWEFLRDNRENRDARFCREYLDFFSLGGRERAAGLLDSMAQELTLAATGYGFRVQALLLEFFQALEDPSLYLLSHIRIDANSQEFLCARILGYLEAHHGRATRQELGRYFHYNGDYLNRLVKNLSGRTMTQLGQRIALEEAQRLLRETELGITEIVQQLGFVNRTYFYRIFRRETGMTPGEYRESHRSGSPAGTLPGPENLP